MAGYPAGYCGAVMPSLWWLGVVFVVAMVVLISGIALLEAAMDEDDDE